MRGGVCAGQTLTPEQRATVMQLALERDGNDWRYSYKQIGDRFGICRSHVSNILLRDAKIKRAGNDRRAKFWRPPPGFEQMYRDLCKHLPAPERRRVVEEHIARRGAIA